MNEPITYEALRAAMLDLRQRYIDYLPLLTNRAHFHPEFDGVKLERDEPYAGVINLYIFERVNRKDQYIHLHYAVGTDGLVSCITYIGYNDWNGAASAYAQPVQEWVESLQFALNESAAKARANARAAALKEDLAAAAWKPERVAALLEKGGWDLVDAL